MSRSLQVSDLSFSHSDVVPVVDRVSFQLGPGFTGVIGANGAGKSTLLALLAGILRPTRGTVSAPGPIHLCPQEAALDEPIRAFAWGWVDGAWALQARLGLDPATLDRWTTLSPGERRRWQIGAALAASPATLLLDEPTDHLDADARHWLLDALAGYRGIGVVVSHDRALLDALASGVLRLDHGRLIHTTGGASAALAAWDAERRATVDALDAASAEVRRSRARLADARRTRDAADRMTHASARMKDRHDSDARGVIAGTLAAWGAAAASTGVHRARDRHQTAVAAHDALDRPGLDGGAIAFPSAPGCRRRWRRRRSRRIACCGCPRSWTPTASRRTSRPCATFRGT
ncbi:MAG: ATP-binding cassette domain-containing protein [Myxococcota bacterium]